MDSRIQSELKVLTEKLIAVPYCCAELKEAGKNWLESAGKDKKISETFVQILEESIEPIDDVIAFFSSDAAAAHFGAEKAKEMLAHCLKIKEEGAVYCDCEACSAAQEILKYKDELLAE